jgi:hypothetical protein
MNTPMSVPISAKISLAESFWTPGIVQINSRASWKGAMWVLIPPNPISRSDEFDHSWSEAA